MTRRRAGWRFGDRYPASPYGDAVHLTRPAELGEMRRSIIAGDCPVLFDADEFAIVLDMTERQVREQFENRIVAGDTSRHLIRAVEVHAALLAMRAPYRSAPIVTVTTCKSCGGPLPLGARRGTRFCGPRCAKMTPSQRARLAEKTASPNSAETLGIETATGAIAGAAMGVGAPAAPW
jgi:hypothetical protein